ncbi:MAG: dihydrolipoamide acyltransferase [Actinobacteria bacterium]|nr:dihydrolipoamide acyltransferase [Actinomycetota bacterium]
MATPVVIPRLGMTMTEATLLEWVVPDGSAVTAGDLLYRIETDKVESDCEAPASGMVRQTVEPGGVHAVGAVIGEIVEA